MSHAPVPARDCARASARPALSSSSSSRARAPLWLVVALLATAFGALAGCAHPPVKPWQREHLAKRAMRFDADPIESRFRSHMTGSREAAQGGDEQLGGGCGCN